MSPDHNNVIGSMNEPQRGTEEFRVGTISKYVSIIYENENFSTNFKKFSFPKLSNRIVVDGLNTLLIEAFARMNDITICCCLDNIKVRRMRMKIPALI